MARNNNLKDFLIDVADAIRAKTGSTSLINPQNFSTEIANFQIGISDAEVAQIKRQVDKLEETMGVYPKPIVYGVSLDKSIMTAGQWESYTDDAVDLQPAYMDFTNDTFVDNGWTSRWPFNQIKPCLVKDGAVVGYLDPNDYTLFEDGTKAGITNRSNGNVMIEFPLIYYKLSSDENKITVQISDKELEGFTDRAFWHKGQRSNKIYVGAYLSGDSYLTSRGFYSISGSLLTDLYTINLVDHYKYNKGTNEEFMPFDVLTLVQCLYLIMFRNTNSQASIGYGWDNLKTNYKTGQMNTKGLYYGKKSGGSGVKLFGLEDFYGVKMTLSTGFYVDSDGHPHVIDVYDPNMTYHPDDITNYPTIEGINFTPTSYFNLVDITGKNELGFVNVSTDKDYTTGFTDSTQPRAGSNSLIFGTAKLREQYGIFNSEAILPTSKDSRRSVRLVYYPKEG